jgi:hypothetical protein
LPLFAAGLIDLLFSLLFAAAFLKTNGRPKIKKERLNKRVVLFLADF